MKNALCKKDFYRYSSALNGMQFYLKKGNYYEYNIVYKDFIYKGIKYIQFEYRDVSGEFKIEDRLDVERFNEHFYTEKEIRKIKLKKLNVYRRIKDMVF